MYASTDKLQLIKKIFIIDVQLVLLKIGLYLNK